MALAKDGIVLNSLSINEGYKHAEQLLPFISTMFFETSIEPKALDAVAVSSGPGSYTGLRIGVATAKGIAYAHQLPIIALNSLEVMASDMIQTYPEYEIYIPMFDARRMEVYTAVYDSELKSIKSPTSLIIDDDSFVQFLGDEPVLFFGDGSDKCLKLFDEKVNFNHVPNIYPNAVSMASLSFEKFGESKFESLINFEPNYLKEFYMQQSSN